MSILLPQDGLLEIYKQPLPRHSVVPGTRVRTQYLLVSITVIITYTPFSSFMLNILHRFFNHSLKSHFSTCVLLWTSYPLLMSLFKYHAQNWTVTPDKVWPTWSKIGAMVSFVLDSVILLAYPTVTFVFWKPRHTVCWVRFGLLHVGYVSAWCHISHISIIDRCFFKIEA